jgi:outer membrane receptor for ferrienterochelin and colicins
LTGAVSSLTAQQTHLIIKDEINEKPVAFANVIIEPLQDKNESKRGFTTDINGKVLFEISKAVKITATFVGYKNLIDTIKPGESRTLFMEPTVYNVDEVVVTAQFRPVTVDKSIYKIKVLGSQQIENKAAMTLNEMLAGELNIRSTRDNALGSSITMQGLQGEHIKFLVDGVPVIGRQNGQIDLEQLDLQNIDHIEIIQGPMSVVYGSNALAGVINIIRKESDRQNMSFNADAYYESVGVYNFFAGGSYSKKKNSFQLNAGRNFFDGFGTVDSSRYQQWKPKLQYTLDGQYMFKTEKSKLKFEGDYFYEQIQDKGNPLEVFNYDKAFDKYFFTNRWAARGELNQKFAKRSILNVLAAYSYYSRTKNTYLKDLTNLEESLVPETDKQDTARFDNLLFRADFNNIIKSEVLKYQLGVDLNYESGYGKRIQDNKQQIGDYAAFLSINYTPIPQLSIQPGIRAIYNTNYNAPLVYSLNVKWNITVPLAVRLSFAKGFRAPSLKELYLDFVDINHNIQGNENLVAETSQNINFALNYNPQTPASYNWGIDFGLFYNHIQNKIELAQISAEPLLYSYINVDEFYTQGFEFNFNNRVYPWLKVILGVAVTGRKQYDESSDTSHDFIYSTDATTQINYWWQKTDIHFSFFYKYNGAYPILVLTDEGTTDISTISAYNSLDINMNRWFWKRRVNVQLGGKNLFNNTNISRTGSQSGGIHSGGGSSVPVNWGRTFFIRVQFKFNK